MLRDEFKRGIGDSCWTPVTEFGGAQAEVGSAPQDGSAFMVLHRQPLLKCRDSGKYNVDNALAAIGGASCSSDTEAAAKALAVLKCEASLAKGEIL